MKKIMNTDLTAKKFAMCTLGALMLFPCTGCEREENVSAPPPDAPASYGDYDLVWSEEFDYEGLPSDDVWVYEEGYMRNNEQQDYKVANTKYSRVEDGRLIIEAFEDAHTGEKNGTVYEFTHSSASVTTKGKVGFQYGRLDVSARIPRGRGIWPAIWMRPVDNLFGGVYAELDIMEYVWGDNLNHDMIWATVHNQDSRDGKESQQRTNTIASPSLDTEFHTYSVVWTETCVDFLFDDEPVLSFPKQNSTYEHWPFDQPFFLILNVAVGGSWGGEWGIDNSIFPARMEVDYVRYYKKTEQKS